MPAWAPFALLTTLPIWWTLGIDQLIWPIIALPMAWVLYENKGRLAAPKGIILWFLFLGWVVLSAPALSDQHPIRWLAFLWRFSFLLSATVVFLYIYNTCNENTALMFAFAATIYWIAIVWLGILGIAYPTLSFESPIASIVPEWFRNNRFVQYAIVERRFAHIDPSGIPRPVAGFPYTNAWGSTFALLMPFVGTTYVMAKRLWHKGLIAAMLALSTLPLFFSLNRGAWLSLLAGLVYVTMFGLRKKQFEATWSGIVAVIMIAGMFLITPLQNVISTGMGEKSGSNTTRLTLYKETVTASLEAPLLGHGAPQPRLGEGKPSAGTHGHVWLVLISQGYPGLIFFLGWLAYLAYSTRNPRTPAACWYHVVIIIGGMQAFFYELTGAGLIIMLIAAALAMREQKSPDIEGRCTT
jgi:O-antigen ligase